MKGDFKRDTVISTFYVLTAIILSLLASVAENRISSKGCLMISVSSPGK